MLEISSEHIWLNQQFGSWQEAIQQIGEQLLEKGVIQKEYIDAMVAR
ncbi:Phosphoenolpyruvate-dependent sugar phosphotransferase system, EIIA 2 [Enterococcus mundtii]|nr:Phosphoenolpyruvate-dependent sugar phosphotransferase system, EIIA 2 [Enterococcus mundtii]